MYKSGNNVWVTVGALLGDGIGDTSLTLSAGHGARLSAFIGTSDFTYLTFVKSTGELEIMKASQPTGDVVPVQRAMFNTGRRVWNVGERGEVRPVSGIFDDLLSVGLTLNTAAGAGGADAYTAAFPTAGQPALEDRMTFLVTAPSANATATPTLNVTLGVTATGAKTIVKGNNEALVPGDIPAAGYRCLFQYNASLDKYVLMNPARSVRQFASGTRMIFQQTTPPVGWTKEVNSAYNDSALRIVTGTAGSSGTVEFSTVFSGSGLVGSSTLSAAQGAVHAHSINAPVPTGGTTGTGGSRGNVMSGTQTDFVQTSIANSSGGSSHNHTIPALKYRDVIVAVQD
jgi:hypothetical protein